MVSRAFNRFTAFWRDKPEQKNQVKHPVLKSSLGDLENEQKEIALVHEELVADYHEYIAACADKAREIFADKLPETVQEVCLEKIQSEITEEFNSSIQYMLQAIIEDTELYILDCAELEKEETPTDFESVIISISEKNIDALQKKIRSAFSQKTQACLADNANLSNMPVDEQAATTEHFTPAVSFRARVRRTIAMPHGISRDNILPEGTKRVRKRVFRLGFEK